MILPYEIVDLILMKTKDPHICISLKRFSLLKRLDYDSYNACKDGHLDVVEYFCARGKQMTRGNMIDACDGGHLDIVKYLYCQGVDFR